MDSIYKHTVLHNDPMVAAQLREVRIATSTVREADSTHKRVRAASRVSQSVEGAHSCAVRLYG